MNGYRLLADTCKSIDEGPDSDNAGKDIRFFRLLEPTWLFKSHRYEEYKNLLLNSFDVSEAISPGNYTYYYKFVGLWDWAEQLPEELFEHCSAIKSITVPVSVKSIEENVFNDCPQLTVRVYEGSFAEKYMIANAIKYALL